MPRRPSFDDHDELLLLRRIAEGVWSIYYLLDDYFNPSATEVAVMTVPSGPLNVGDTFSPVGTAQDANGVTVPSATVSWTIDDPSVLGVVDNGSVNGVGGATCTALAEGNFTLTAVATNTDGSSVSAGPGDPVVGSVVAAVPTVATEVAVS